MVDEQIEAEKLLEELRGLATEIHQRAYAHIPQWKASASPRGLVSQIDNMVAGLLERLEKTEAALSWILPPYATNETSEGELRKRVLYAAEDYERIVAKWGQS